MRSFIAIGGGVGIGTLGVTHGLGPEQAKPPPPPTPTAQVSSPWEREENWRRKRQRDAQDFAAWRFYSDPAQQKQRRESEARARAEGARVEQERIRAADLLYRFRPEGTEGKPVWGPPLGAFAESAATTPAPEDVYATAGDVPTVVAEATPTTLPEPIEGVEIEPESPLADYAIIPVGDDAKVEALADGTLEVFLHPKTGLTAELVSDTGQRFVYAGLERTAPRRVRAGEAIGFTPSRARRDAVDGAVKAVASPGTRTPAALPEPTPAFAGPSWPRVPTYARRSARAAATAGAPRRPAAAAPPPPRPPLDQIGEDAPLPPPRDGRTGALLVLGLLGALVLTGGGRRR